LGLVNLQPEQRKIPAWNKASNAQLDSRYLDLRLKTALWEIGVFRNLLTQLPGNNCISHLAY
jgi:hypothetical protein